MATTINASTSNGLIQTADTSGVLALQAADTTIASVSSTGVAVTGAITATGQIAAIKSETAQATTSGTTKDFTSIPSWVKQITVMYTSLSTNGSSIPIIQFGTGATPTYTTSGYLGTATRVTGTPGLVAYSSGFLIADTWAAGSSVSGQFIFSNLTGNNWVGTSINGSTSGGNVNVSGGSVPLGAVLTAVRLTTVNGTDAFDAGSVNILYEG